MSNRRTRALAVAAITLSGVAGAVLAVAGNAAAATACSVDYAVTSQWPGGFVANVNLKNLGDPVSTWKLTWSFGSGQQITTAWNTVVSQSGAQVTAGNASYNGSLAGNASASFGFQGTWTGSNPVPASFSMNGVTCTGGPPVTTGPATTAPTTTRPATTAPTTTRPATTAPATTTPGSSCPAAGHITYTLSRAASPTADQLSAYNLITQAMDQAISVYNCYTNITKALRVSYEPSVATADGNINGSIRFGARSTMQQITAMHEISHTVGVGTDGSWSSHLSGGIWTGGNATSQLRAITGDSAAVVHGDSQHFWPYGLNYTSEVSSSADLVAHCRMVVALRKDMGYSN